MKIFSLLSFLFALLVSNSAFAQKSTPPIDSKEREITGLLIKKPWSKSTDSYCAQGSDFYVLQTKDDTHILDFSEYKNPSNQWSKWVNKTVRIKGESRTRTIKAPDDPMMQRPADVISPDGKKISSDFTCTVFVVKSINPTPAVKAPSIKGTSKTPTKTKGGK